MKHQFNQLALALSFFLFSFTTGDKAENIICHNTNTNFTLPTFIVDSTCPKKSKYCKGEATFKDGSTYKGEFRYGNPHGNGIYTWTDGETYDGELSAGLRHGKGTHTYKNNDVYSGDWEFGMMHGQGTCLLYTSPSPRDQRGSRMPSSA